jgi:hypothetical protein
MTLSPKQRKTVIAISAITITGAIATLVYFSLKNKKKKAIKAAPEQKPVQAKPQVNTEKGLFNTDPEDVSSNPQVVKLNDKIYKLNYLIDPFGVNNGQIVYVEAKDFKPGQPNQPVAQDMSRGMWSQIQKRMDDVYVGFNKEVSSEAAKVYGNQELKKLQDRLDSIFNPAEYNRNADWHKKWIETITKKNLNTNFWA